MIHRSLTLLVGERENKDGGGCARRMVASEYQRRRCWLARGLTGPVVLGSADSEGESQPRSTTHISLCA